MWRRRLTLPRRWPPGALLVGGAARDLLRGAAPGDWDWAAPDPELAAEWLGRQLDGAVFALDQERGYYRVVGPAEEQHDVVPLPADLTSELLRRDFTVNALALAPDGQVHDPSEGQRDLRARTLRMVSEANLRSDPLRLLRAARLSITLGFRIEPQTREAVIRLAGEDWPSPAAERVREELHALLLHPQAARGVRLLEELHLLQRWLPELREGLGVEQGGFHHLDVFQHNVEALHQLVQRFPEAPLALRWATLLHDVGKPRSRSMEGGQTHYYGHARLGAELAGSMLARLKAPAALETRVSALVAAHMVPLPQNEREARRFVHRRRELLPDLLQLMLADREAARGPQSSAASRRYYQQGMDRVLAALEEQPSAPAPLLRGQEVMQLLSLAPGPAVGEAVAALAEARALGEIHTPEEARVWLRDWAERRG
ncbi:HD domain-containing protein [Deinococcus sonorensis]|uniref:HD domain-containing protein n=2 Tax=Deinococcus sonorensis TaxID=309891 RepID=A0AAU7UBH9_9DEIO